MNKTLFQLVEFEKNLSYPWLAFSTAVSNVLRLICSPKLLLLPVCLEAEKKLLDQEALPYKTRFEGVMLRHNSIE